MKGFLHWLALLCVALNASAQTGAPNLVVTDPPPVCAPNRINLTDPSITAGSDPGLVFQYFTDAVGVNPVANPSVVNAGKYYIKATNRTTGATSALLPVQVTVNSQPKVLINPAVVCAPDRVDLTAPAVTAGSDPGLAYTYYADAAATMPLGSATAVPAATYYIKGINPATGCASAPVAVVATINSKPDLNVNNQAVCAPAKIDLTAPAVTNGSSGNLVLQYFTETDVDAQFPLSAAAAKAVDSGSYYIKATDVATGCSTVKPVEATVNPIPKLLFIANPPPVCAPNTVDLSYNVYSVGTNDQRLFNQYYHSDKVTVEANPRSVKNSGTYYIQGTDENGCKSVMTPIVASIIPQPVFTVNDPAPVIAGGTADLTSAAVVGTSADSLNLNYFSFLYEAPQIGDHVPDPKHAPVGIYYLTASSKATGCWSSVMTVTITEAPPETIVLKTNNIAVCAPATGDLTLPAVTAGSSPGLQFTYYTTSDTTARVSNPAVVNSGVYYIVATDAKGQKSAATPVTVTINSKPTLMVNNPADVCAPATIDLTDTKVTAGSDNALTFNYYLDAALIHLVSNPRSVGAGAYYIVAVNQAGCTSDPKMVNANVNKVPVVVINRPAGMCAGITTDLTAPAITAGSEGGLIYSYYNFITGMTLSLSQAQAVDSGLYYITGVNPITGCAVQKSMEIWWLYTPTLVVNSPLIATGAGTADLTAPAVTAGTSDNATFAYYTDAALTHAVPDPTEVVAGTYYIVAANIDGCKSSPAIVQVTANSLVLKVNNPPAVCAPSTVDLTASAITQGSSPGLTFSYFTNAAASAAVPDPVHVTAGVYYIVATDPLSGAQKILPVTVAINPQPDLKVTNPAAVCAPAGIDLTAPAITAGSTGVLVYHYYMADKATVIPDPTKVAAGTYFIQSANQYGCTSNMLAVTAIINAKPVVAVTQPAVACAPYRIDLTATVTAGNSPDLSYRYFLADGVTIVPNPSAVAAGTYYIQGTNPKGCSSNMVSVTATINAQPTLVINNPAAVCAPNRVNLTAAAITAGSDAALAFSYYLNADGTMPVADPSRVLSGTYYIKAVSPATGCSTPLKPVIVLINAQPKLVINDPAAVCAPGLVDITAPAVTAGSDAGLSFSYYYDLVLNAPVANPQTLGSGTYYVVATNSATGCYSGSASVRVNVNPKPKVIAQAAAVCYPATINLTTPAVVQGSDNNLVFAYYTDMAGTYPVPAPASVAAGSYYIIGTNVSTGCSSDPQKIDAIVNELPAIAPVTGAGSVAVGASIPLYDQYAGGIWSSSDNTIAAVNENGVVKGISKGNAVVIYQITNTATGCMSQVNTQVNVTDSVQQPATPLAVKIQAQPGTAICTDKPVQFTAAVTGGAAVKYVWLKNGQQVASGNSYSAASAANGDRIACLVTNAAGDAFADSLQMIVFAKPAIQITGNSAINENEQTQLYVNGTGKVEWTPATGLSDASSASPKAAPAATTTYNISLTDAHGCVNTASFTVNVTPLLGKYNKLMTPDGDGINDNLVIAGLAAYPDNKLQVVDRSGRLVFQQTGYSNNWDGRVNGKSLPADVYYFVLTVKGEVKIKGSVVIIHN
ncbi:gliding motility-associated C-terminal domain-containing protein [Deminuibacter soli]|uniref:Ig-like domain-containing protein n=1 Tax=Deminuibacter soli TaxID=2291815 RepID=A0A3E1NNM0_9BACT|nr:gliding motility-associated C-terminal domain-containing protein [Deminuibacter soli]RFM29526.1 hypothetical protein DXN05_00640 [Deminuibacter soli]